MSVSPVISIITPSYNQGAYLEQTIDSVLSQNYPALQYMIIDGGSTDNSADIIRKYEKYLYRWVSEKDAGQSDAINKGFLLATGDVVNVLNSDDWYTANTLHRIGELFRQPDVHVVCGRSRIMFNGKEIRQNKGTDVYPGNLEKTIGCARIDQPETFFRRIPLVQAGLLNPQLHYIWDKDWWMRYLLCFGLDHIISIPDLLVNFRLHEESKTFKYLEEFNRENFDLFYSLALDNAPALAESLLQVMHPRQLSGRLYSTIPVLPTIDYHKILNYFIWERIQMAYAQNRYGEAKNLLKLVDATLLDANERAIIQTIRRRMKILPVWFKKIWNTLR
jgi:glycosyltransferase involved in cell wall biosynthesis